jgi:hypothetical protein
VENKLHNVELNDLYSSPNIVLVIVKENGMGGACSAFGWRGMAYTGFWWGNVREIGHLGDPGVNWRIILRWIFSKWDVGGMDWIYRAEDRDRWRTLMNGVMNLRVP